MWEKILTTAVTVLVSLIITLLFNGIINLPQKKRQKEQEEISRRQKEREEAEVERTEFRKDLLNSIGKENEKIYSELKKHTKTDKEVTADLKLCKLGLQAVIKNTLKTRYEKWINEGYAPLDAKDDLERAYQVYHKLGANGVMDSLRERFLALPDVPPSNRD